MTSPTAALTAGAAKTDSHDAAVERQFGPQAAAYVQSAVHAAGEDLDWIERRVREIRPAKALDLGTGGGHVAYRLAPFSGQVIASDLSPGMIDAVIATARGKGLANVAGDVSRAEALPFADAAFDLVASRFTAHHWHDFPAGLREARRVLKPGAPALFVDGMGIENPLADTFLQSIELLRDPSHVRDYRADEWIAALGQAGFIVSSVQMRRIRLDFVSWIARMRTDPAHVAAIRSLQQGAASEVRERLGIEEDGSFMLDTIAIECV